MTDAERVDLLRTVLDRRSQRHRDALVGVVPSRGDIERLVHAWNTEWLLHRSAPQGSAMRRVIDVGLAVTDALQQRIDHLEARLVEGVAGVPQ